MLFFQKRLGALVNKTKFLEDIGILKDGDYEVVVFKRDRSSEQNRYLRAVYGYIADYTGYDPEYIHEVMKHKFLMDYSKKVPVPRSTASLNTKEFAEYVDSVRDFVAPHGIYIPTPDEWRHSIGLS